MANNASNEQTGLPPQVHDADVSEGDRVAPLIRFSVEGRRRQRRHADIQEMANQDAYQAMGGKLDSSGCIPDDADRSCIESVWQINLPRRLLALSYLGVFKFRILLTSSPVDALFFDQHHPMITTGHLPHNDEEQFIVQRLRDEFPNWPLIQEQVRLQPNSHLAHALGAAATVICDALFYYVANGMVVVVEKQLTPEEVEAEQPLPDNIAGVAKPTTPYTNRLALDENAIPLASPAGLFRIMRIFRHLLGDPFTREMCCEGPGCRHYDLLLGFLACHEDTLRHLTEPLSAQQAWEFYRVGTPNENEPLPVSESDTDAVQGWTRYRVFGANAFHDQDDGEGEVETPLLSFVFNADGIAISVSIDTAGPHPDLGGALQQGGDDDLDTSLSDDSDFGPDQA